MVHPFQEESLTAEELKASHDNVDGFFHVTTTTAAEEISITGIKKRSHTEALPLSCFGDPARVYFFGRKLCVQKWARGRMANHGPPQLAIIEFKLEDDTPIAWDHNPGMESYMAFHTAFDVPAMAIVVIETVGPELRSLLYDEHGNRR
jgi:hypothetical protein